MPFKISINDITQSVKDKGENTTLLKFSSDGIVPIYAQEFLATYLLMEWPITGSDEEFLRCYALLLPHGKTHVAEVFFLRQKSTETLLGEYLGTTKIFTILLPENQYLQKMDEIISELIWSKVCGYAPQ